jgi:membrane fusion protein, heavy metal efflux system
VLAAPFDGTIVARDAVAGRTAAAGHVLLEVADLSRMWAQLDVPEAEAARVRPGQRVTITFDAIPGLRREATIARVGSAIDPASRTLHVRAELPNPDRALKAGLLVRGELQVGDEHGAVLVPRDAVQLAEGQALFFVRASPVTFLPVPVEVAEPSGDLVAVAGISPGDEVVTTGAFLLKTEILKDSIGAGCCASEKPE